MVQITDKSYKEYDYISRYSTFPYYYNPEDGKYMQGMTGQLNDKSTYVLYKVKQNDTLDTIALDMYSNSTYFWVIADFNRIRDPFKRLGVGSLLKIPTLSNIKFKEI